MPQIKATRTPISFPTKPALIYQELQCTFVLMLLATSISWYEFPLDVTPICGQHNDGPISEQPYVTVTDGSIPITAGPFNALPGNEYALAA